MTSMRVAPTGDYTRCTRDDIDRPADRRGARRARRAGCRRRGAARRRRDGAVHRPLPQGGDRARSTTRSCAPSRSGCATCASWRSGATAILESIRDAGQARRRARGQIMAADTKARLEDIYLPYKPKRRTKAQIAREAGLEPLADALLVRPGARPGGRGATLRRRRKGRRRRGRRAGRRPRDPGRALRRGRRPDRGAARARCGRSGRLVVQGPATARRQPAPSSPTTSTSPSRSPSCPRTASWRMFRGEKEEILERRHRAGRGGRAGGWPGRARSRPGRLRAQDRAPLRHRRPRPSRRPVAGRHRPLGLAHQDPSRISASTCGCGCGRRPRTRRCGCSPPTCATCCSPRRPAPAPRWASTPASAPA